MVQLPCLLELTLLKEVNHRCHALRRHIRSYTDDSVSTRSHKGKRHIIVAAEDAEAFGTAA